MKPKYEVTKAGKVLIKHWTKGVRLDDNALAQLKNTASLPFIHKWLAVMPDVHLGQGATIGSVIATDKAIIPAAVGVDIGCGMAAVKTSLTSRDLPDNLNHLRYKLEAAIPHGRTNNGKKSSDRGSWRGRIPTLVQEIWKEKLESGFKKIEGKYPWIASSNNINHLGTLGGGNHFVEVCIDEFDSVWIMLHSGSRGVGNKIGTSFIALAKRDMEKWMINLPDKDLAYIPEGSDYFNDYVDAVRWAQQFAKASREIMMTHAIQALSEFVGLPFNSDVIAVDCHHNYVSREKHYNKHVWVTRKGAVSAKLGQLGIIPSSMGAKSFIVRGLGNPESFRSCSHGAGRVMSRTQAKKEVNLAEHQKALKDVECDNTLSTIDETPSAYKPIDDVMKAQSDLVEILHTLKQVVCIKG